MFGKFYNWLFNDEQTQIEKIDAYVKANGSITAIEAASKEGITSMHRRITDMKRKGYVFSSVWERGNTNKRYRRYFIIARPKPCGNINQQTKEDMKMKNVQSNSQSGFIGFAALVALAAATLVGGFTVGQQNPDAKNILEANPNIVETQKYTVDERF